MSNRTQMSEFWNYLIRKSFFLGIHDFFNFINCLYNKDIWKIYKV